MTRPLVVIVGPTASGKSALAIELARRFGGEIVVCDSTQIYRGFDIGTAKLLPDQWQGIPHHLTDLVDAEDVFHAGAYRRLALAALDSIAARGRLPIVTAGTGLYLRALLEGLCEAPERDEALRERLRRRGEQRGPAYLHRMLQRLDPEAARRIAVRDVPKVIRAIEVALLAGRPLSELQQGGRPGLPGYRVQKIGLLPPRTLLYERINQRVLEMLARGWLDEVRWHLERGLSPRAKPLQFIGYRQLYAYLQGSVAYEQAVEQIQRATRRYAKRQLTWFRRDPEIRWHAGFGDDPAVVEAASEQVRSFLRQQGVQAPARVTAVQEQRQPWRNDSTSLSGHSTAMPAGSGLRQP
jgi:tRNA dimethylallyltransferase